MFLTLQSRGVFVWCIVYFVSALVSFSCRVGPSKCQASFLRMYRTQLVD